MLTKVKLYGELQDKYGESFEFDVSTVREAVLALSANFPTFMSDIRVDGEYNIFVDDTDIAAEEVVNPIGSNKTIKIVPIVSGSKGAFKIILGAILIYITAGTAGGYVGAWLGGGQAALVASAAINSIGYALLLGGISEILFTPPSGATQESPDSRPSYLFQGQVNSVAQGGPVPVGYGRLIIGSTVLSAAINTRDTVGTAITSAPITAVDII